MIEHVCDFNFYQQTSLTVAAFNRLDYLDLFIDKVISFIQPFDKNISLLHKLVYNHFNSGIVLQALLKKKLINYESKDFFYDLVNLEDDMQRNLLHLAYLHNLDDKIIELLINYGVDAKTLEAMDSLGNTPLDYAYLVKKIKFY